MADTTIHPLVRTAAAAGLALAAGGLSPFGPVAAAATRAPGLVARPTDPVLWQGVLRAPSGKGLASTVTFYARTAGFVLHPLTTAATATDGSFTARLAWSGDLAALVDRDGNLTVVAVGGADGVGSIAVNTVRWVPEASGWAAAGQAVAAQRRAAALGTRAYVGLKAVSTDLRTVADPGRPAARADATPQAVPPPKRNPGCEPFGSAAIAPSKSYVGEINVAQSSPWTVTFTYQNTGTSAYTVGFTAAGSNIWQSSGSTTTASSLKVTGQGQVTASPNQAIARKYWITSYTYEYTWKCWFLGGTPPASVETWPTYYTVEKGGWYSDFAADTGSQLPACTAASGTPHDFVVGPSSSAMAEQGTTTSLTNSYTVGIPQNPTGFTGGVAVTNTNTSGATVTYRWANRSATASKHLCGLTGKPVLGNTRVVAGNMTDPPINPCG